MKNYDSLIFAAKKLGGKTEKLAAWLQSELCKVDKDVELVKMAVWSLRYDLLLSQKVDELAFNSDKYLFMYRQRHPSFNNGSWMDKSCMD